MVREDLEDIPDHSLPDDFYFTFYKNSSDADTWLNIQNQAADGDCFEKDLFEETYNGKTEALKERLIFICDKSGSKIGTATAWYEDKETALVHWVAVIPSYQGRGLAKPLLTETLIIMVKLGYKKAILRTQPVCTTAIALYKKYGFKLY